ncbi:MAG TPA: 3'-5' exonuclease, partial [Gammaproteobacteria bacterium]|nr:3'-5' exonuclease [Gammaproteobacteria bacterium]
MQTTSVATTRGFILQATYRVTGPDERRVPVVYLYGRLEDGSTFRVRDDRRRPCFYIRSSDAEAAARIGTPTPAPTDRKTFAGSPVARIEVAAPSDVPPLRDRLHAAGIDTFEADVRFASRYLIERGIKAGCEITGDATPGERIAWHFENPTLKPARVELEPRVLSFDIETDPSGRQLLAISLYARGVD